MEQKEQQKGRVRVIGTIPPNHLLDPSAPPNDEALTEAAKEKQRRSPDDTGQ